MDRATIESLMDKAQNRFNEINQYQETVKAKLKEFGLNEYHELQEEMNRLQGDFRTLDSIRQAIPTPAVTPPAEPAKTVVAKEKVNAKPTK
jgi:hypothetical protein